MDVQSIAGAKQPGTASTVFVAPVAVQHAGAVDAASAATPPTTPAPTLDQVKDAVNSINRSMGSLGRGLEFSVDSNSHRTIVKVIDQKTKELIRQIPTVETLEIAQALDRASGLLIKQTA
jgi:flagellar protein FlaG